MLSKQSVEKLLGRTLTSNEASNFDQYIKTTFANLENLVCWTPICGSGERTYRGRPNYHTLWLEPFTKVKSVTIDGKEVTAFTPIFNDSYNSPIYNGIEFDYPLGSDKVIVDATWGFNFPPADLGQLIGALFMLNTRLATEDPRVRSKSVEDFSLTYNNDGEFNSLIKTYSNVIAKYSICSSEIQHGGFNERLFTV